jgi:hypothetical protein
MTEQPPVQPPPPPPPPGTYGAPVAGQQNGLAIAGMVVGISSLVLFFLAWIATIIAIVGLVLSLVGLNKSKQLGGLGRGMAVAGVVTSSIGIVASIVITIYAVQRYEELGGFGFVLPIPALRRRVTSD